MIYARIKRFHEQRPFKPFDIKMSDGRVYTGDRPEFLSQSRSQKYVLFVTNDDREVIVDVRQIQAREAANPPTA